MNYFLKLLYQSWLKVFLSLTIVSAACFFSYRFEMADYFEEIKSNDFFDLTIKKEEYSSYLLPVIDDVNFLSNLYSKHSRDVLYDNVQLLILNRPLISHIELTHIKQKITTTIFRDNVLVKRFKAEPVHSELVLNSVYISPMFVGNSSIQIKLMSKINPDTYLTIFVDASVMLNFLDKVYIPSIGLHFLFDHNNEVIYTYSEDKQNLVKEIFRRYAFEQSGQIHTREGILTYDTLFPVPEERLNENGEIELPHYDLPLKLKFNPIQIASFIDNEQINQLKSE